MICYLSYVAIYVARLNLSMAAPALKDLHVLTTEQVGLLGSIFSIVYACGRLVSGVFSDRIAPWKMICTGLTLSGIANLVFGVLPPFAAMALLWGVNAVAQSLIWGSLMRNISVLYPEHLAKKRASQMGTAVAAGNLVGILVNSRLIEGLGVQWAFLIPGGITLLFTLLVMLLCHGVNPPPSPRKNADFFRLLGNNELRHVLAPAFLHGIIKDNISLWMAVYVVDQFGKDLASSAYYMLLIPAVGLAGRLLVPTLYSLCKNRETTLMALSFAANIAVCLLLVFFPVNALFAVCCLSLIYLLTSVINTCLLALYPMRFAAENAVASAAGILDFFSYLGNGAGAAVFGIFIARWGYWSMFAAWAGASLLALLLLCNRQK